MNKCSGFIVLMVLLAACGHRPAATALPATPVRHATPVPDATGTPPATTASPVPPTLTASAVPLELTRTAAGKQCDLGASRLNQWEQVFSPDGLWAAVVCEGDPLLTTVYRLDGSQVWRLPAYTLEFTTAADRAFLLPFHWSPDGRYLYLASSICCLQEAATAFENGYSLLRLDLSRGSLVPILGPLRQRDGYALSFSPGDRYLIYVPPGEITLVHMIDLRSGSDNVIHLKAQYWDAGFFSWSPGGSQVLFAAGMPDWVTGEGGFSLLLYDLPNEKLRLLIDNDLRQPAPVGATWLNEKIVPLMSLVNGEKLQLDVPAQEISAGQ